MVRVISFTFLFIFIGDNCYGTEGAAFLTLTPGARAIGLGQCFVAIADDPSACYFNPAGLAFINQAQILSMNLSPPPGVSKATLWGLTELSHPLFCQKIHSPLDPKWGTEEFYGRYMYWSGAFPFKCKQAIGFSIDYFKTGPIHAYGNIFYPYDCALSISYGRKIVDNLSFGVTAKYIYEFLWPQWLSDSLDVSYSGSSYSFAFDGGLLFKSGIGFSIGASLSNLGPPIKVVETEGVLPLTARIGLVQSITEFFAATSSNENNFIKKLNQSFHFLFTIERKIDLAGESRIHKTSCGFEAKIFDLLSYRQGFRLTKQEYLLWDDPKSISLDLKIAEFDITITNSNYYAGCWWIQSKFKPLENKPEFLKKNKALDRIFLNLSCLAIPGGGQLYNGDKWRALPYLIASFFVADVILESHNKPSWQDEAYNTVVMTLPILYILSGVQANLALGGNNGK
ncbi:MAG: hypothetical protein ABIL70_01225 [candidate division WOR-3 bacterium]